MRGGIPVAFSLTVAMALCQSPAHPAFDAAAVKLNHSGERFPREDFRPGRFELRNFSLRMLIAIAYQVREEDVSGGPPWVNSERYDVIAKVAPARREEHLRMLQTLLADQFRLALHRVEKAGPGYALGIAKNGPKLQRIDPPLTGEAPCRTVRGRPGDMKLACRGTLADLAAMLPHLAPSGFDLPLLDQTGLKDAFEFQMEWSISPHVGVPGYEGPTPSVPLTITEALESQLGLKVVRKKVTLPAVVIDRAERPLS